MRLGNFLTAMFVVYLLSIAFGCWLNLKESRKEQLYWMKRTEQEMVEHERYLGMRNDKQIKMLPVHPYGKTLCRVYGGRRQDDWKKDAL